MHPRGDSLDLAERFEAAAAESPLAGLAALGRDLANSAGASDICFLIADYSGHSLVRLSHAEPRRVVSDVTNQVVPLSGTVQGDVLRLQQVRTVASPDGIWVCAPVSNRGEAIGVLEVVLPAAADDAAVRYVASAARLLAYLVIANRRYTDLFEWGQRTTPATLEAEIQRRLLPGSFTCEANQFTVAGWLEPAESVAGDTFDYAVDEQTLHISITDAMGHGVEAALMATVLLASLRNSRRRGAGLSEQADVANHALFGRTTSDQFVTGQLVRVDLASGIGHVINAGHVHPLRVRGGRVADVAFEPDLPFGMFGETTYRLQQMALEPGDRLVFLTDGMIERGAVLAPIRDLLLETREQHTREAAQALADAVLQVSSGHLEDDATVFLLDWYGDTRFRSAKC